MARQKPGEQTLEGKEYYRSECAEKERAEEIKMSE
jgi:hypothetical protein